MPGHQAGHCGFLDKKYRILFGGDDFVAMRIGIAKHKPGLSFKEYATVTGLRNELVKLVERINEFDSIFPGHFILDIDSKVVIDLLDTCNVIINNPEKCDFTEELFGKVTKFKFVKGLGTLAYNDMNV